MALKNLTTDQRARLTAWARAGDLHAEEALANIANEQTLKDEIDAGGGGVPGPQGPAGPKGDTGDTGPQGPAGADGSNGADAVWNYTGAYNPGASYSVGDLAAYDGKLWYRTDSHGGNVGDTPFVGSSFWDLIADKGAKGDQGDPGDSMWSTSGTETVLLTPTNTVTLNSALDVIDATPTGESSHVDPYQIRWSDGSTLAAMDVSGISISDTAGDVSARISVTTGTPTITSQTVAAPVPAPLNLALGELQINGDPGTSNQFLKSVGPGAAPVWSAGTTAAPARVYTVGTDAATIQGCIDLCTGPSLSNAYIINIPPGSYTENLTLKKQVHLRGMTNPNDTSTVKITGNHTFSGTDVNAVNNRVTLANIIFVSSHATNPTLDLSGTVASQLDVSGCYFQNSNTSLTSKIITVSTNVSFYARNCVFRMSGPTGGGAAQGGTHFTNNGGSFYLVNGLDVDGGTRVLNAAGGYSLLLNSQFSCQSENVGATNTEMITVAVGIQVYAGYCSFTNNATNGHGVNLLGLNSSMLAGWCAFNILSGASNYVVTGGAGSAFITANNNYGNITGVITRNVKIKNTVTPLTYTVALTPSA